MRALHHWLSMSCAVVGVTFAFAPLIGAQAKPANATAQCKDGSYSQAKTERGACSGHGGVGVWYGTPKTEAKTAAKDNGAAAKDASRAVRDESKAMGATKAKTGGNDINVPTIPAKEPPKGTRVAPTGATGQCADGSYTKAKSERGACSGHGGVSLWVGDTATNPAPIGSASAPTPSRPTPPPAATANPPATAAPTPPTSTKASNIQTPPAGTPENATAQCNDGTFSFAKQHRGACSGHKGVKAWFK